ncbi:MAG: hypothetical protein LBP32_07195 [Spirochaetaceae bacterium]|jgi:hypothetical protein|nr:hypothetical protein [Spirochaetaceae bacterium]
MIKQFRAGPLFHAILAALVLVSCASSPRIRSFYQDREDEFAALAPGARAYFYVDVPGARTLLDRLSFWDLKGASQALDMTESAVAAVYTGGGRRFLAAARGSYPGLRTRLSFALSPAWKKVRSETGLRYWRSAGAGLSVSLDDGRALVSDGDPFVPGPGARGPANLGEFRRGAVLAGWFDETDPINRFIASLGIPIQIPADRLVFGVYPVGGADGGEKKYEAALCLETPSESHAGALASLFSMVRLYLSAAEIPAAAGPIMAALFRDTPARDGSNLLIRTGVMEESEIALLLNMFSLY